MSEIDTIDHSHIGYLADIPVYHPLACGTDMNVNPGCLVIGGGSGEHPMLVIRNFNSCVAAYFSHRDLDEDETNDKLWLDFFELYTRPGIIDTDWEIAVSARFYNRMKPFLDEHKFEQAEFAILCIMGEFLLFNGQHLIDPFFVDQWSKKPFKPIYSVLSTTFNDDYPLFGKVIVNGATRWGFAFSDEASFVPPEET